MAKNDLNGAMVTYENGLRTAGDLDRAIIRAEKSGKRTGDFATADRLHAIRRALDIQEGRRPRRADDPEVIRWERLL